MVPTRAITFVALLVASASTGCIEEARPVTPPFSTEAHFSETHAGSLPPLRTICDQDCVEYVIDEWTLNASGLNLTDLTVTLTWAQTPTTSRGGLRLQVYHVTREGEGMHGDELAIESGTSPLTVRLENLSIPLNETSFLMVVAGYAAHEVAPAQGAIVSSETPYSATAEGKGVRIAASGAGDEPERNGSAREDDLRQVAPRPSADPILI